MKTEMKTFSGAYYNAYYAPNPSKVIVINECDNKLIDEHMSRIELRELICALEQTLLFADKKQLEFENES